MKKNYSDELKDFDIKIEKISDTSFNFYMNEVIRPGARPRVNRYGAMYDPLSSYKNYIKRLLRKKCDELEILPNSDPVSITCEISIKPPKSFSEKKSIYAIKNKIYPTVKPDNDNFEKTIFDLFKNILWLDDNQIYENYTIKKYGYNNSTKIHIEFFHNYGVNGKLTNKDKEKLTDDDIKFLQFKKEERLNAK